MGYPFKMCKKAYRNAGLSYAQLSDIGLERDGIHAAALRAAHM